jgi:AsmA protein
MKPLKIAALGFAAVASLGLAFGVPAVFLTTRVQDQIESRTGYRLRVDGPTKLAFLPSPTITLDRISLVDVGSTSATSFAAESVRVSLSLANLFSGRPGITEVAIVKPVVRAPLLRRRESRAGGAAAPPQDEGAAATPAFTVGRLVIEDGTLVMSNARDRVEMRVDRIGITASLSADEGRLEAHAYAGDQPVRLQASAKSPAAGFEGNVPVDFSFEAPGLLEGTLTGASDVGFAGSILRITGITGKIGDSKLNGWASFDFSSKLLVKGDFDVQRLELMAALPGGSAVSGPRGGAQSPASQSWSTQQVRLAGLNYVDADVQFSTAELKVGTLRFAPIAVQVTLADGLLRAALSRSSLYGGRVEGTASIDVSGSTPMHAFRIDLMDVRASQLLSDVAEFEALDGRLQTKIDVQASGDSEREVMSSLSGSVDARIQDGQILGINVPKMIRTLAAKTLTGWQESRTKSTDLSDLSASFRLKDGHATTSNLRVLGPLVRINGSGTIDLAAKTLQFRLVPKLVASLEGEGGTADPLGFGVPVNVEGSWSDPRIFPDVAGILSDPDGAYAKLNALGQRLFGKGQDGGLHALMQGLGTILGPKNERRPNSR